MVRYESLSDLLNASNIGREPSYEDFDIFSFDQLSAEVKKMMPPHRRRFYTIIFFKDQKSGQISINQSQHASLTDVILFQGMDHIFSFVRDKEVEGGVILFKDSFLLPHVEYIDQAFPFFSVLNQNLFHLNLTEQETFKKLFNFIYGERGNPRIVKLLLLALLEKSNHLYSTYASEEKYLSKKTLTVRKYKSLISNSFLENREVGFYADQLNVSSNYLNEIVKSETGISAKRHISERLLLEAKNLLHYSEMDITEISYVLQFSEPTHFTKFFKKETGTTPKSFQRKKP
ncbi:MAG: helix-turn-helix domain-containing protein [Bacteroidota bacterium]